MTTMRRRHLAAATLAVLAGLATTAASTATASPRIGPTTPVARYVTVAGNARYLVYAEAVRVNPIDPRSFNRHVELYLLHKHGAPTRLGPVGPSAHLYSLSGSNLVVVDTVKGESYVQSWNLATGRHRGEATTEDIVGASPDGWLFELDKPDGTHVFSQSYSGALIDFGDPLATGVDYAVTSGPDGFVAYADNFVNENGQITYTPWAHPDRHRTLLTAKHQNNACASVTSRFAACGLGGSGHPLVLLPLDGSTPTTVSGTCASSYAVWGSHAGFESYGGSAGCERGHVGELSRAGDVTLSKRRYSVVAVTTAWGRLVASSRVQRGLVTLTSARAKPHPLRRADIG